MTALPIVILALVTLQRLSELIIAQRNTRALLARGAIEVGAAHYPLIVLLHAAWLIGLWILARDRAVNIPLIVIFVMLQAFRIWILVTLGPRWTTRIIVLPGATLVARGPYRLIRHPNYAVVIAEIAVLPLAFGLYWYAVIFSILNAAVLAIRISVENKALGLA